VKVDRSTQVRAEAGYSTGGGRSGHAFVGEVQHRTTSLDARGYIREQSLDFGVGQTNTVEAGYRKSGLDVVAKINSGIDVGATAYQLDDLSSDARRRGLKLESRAKIDAATDVTANVQTVMEKGRSGGESSVTQIGGTVTRTLLNNRLILTGEAATSISGSDTVATPSRYRVGASYAITPSIRAIVDHEIASGSGVTGSNTRVGAEVVPWTGAAVSGSWNQQAIGENGDRTYGAFGAKQSFQISKAWTADLSLDSSRTISGAPKADIVNPLNPPTLGGRIENGYLDNDYTSVSAGLARQSLKTSWTGRAEARLGSDRRYGLSTGLIHQMDNGRVWGGSATAYKLNQNDGGQVDHADAAFSIAMRRPTDRLQFLDKLEMVYDRILLGTGSPGYYTLPASQSSIAALADDGYGPVSATSQNAKALRFVNNLAVNWIAAGSEDRGTRTQVSFYYGSKYSIQSFDGDKYGGYTDMVSMEARHDVTRWLDVGIQAGAKHSWSAGTLQYSIGPTIGISPVRNSWFSLGYNMTGFGDRDFSAARATVKGPWIALRMKFDEETLGLVKKARR
jgi:hypothetical protein